MLVSPQEIRGQRIALRDTSTVHHLCRVLRVKVGDRLQCLDGAGSRYFGAVMACSRDAVLIEVDRRLIDPPQPHRLTLAQALIRPERFEWVIEKATELGVSRLVPMMTHRTVRGQLTDRGPSRLERWRRIAAGAMVQSGRAVLPVIDAPRTFREVLEQLKGQRALLLLSLAAQAVPLRAALVNHQRGLNLALLVGPEGDFSPEELEQAAQGGAEHVSLGYAVLRSETAAIAAVAIVQHLTGAG